MKPIILRQRNDTWVPSVECAEVDGALVYSLASYDEISEDSAYLIANKQSFITLCDDVVLVNTDESTMASIERRLAGLNKQIDAMLYTLSEIDLTINRACPFSSPITQKVVVDNFFNMMDDICLRSFYIDENGGIQYTQERGGLS